MNCSGLNQSDCDSEPECRWFRNRCIRRGSFDALEPTSSSEIDAHIMRCRKLHDSYKQMCSKFKRNKRYMDSLDVSNMNDYNELQEAEIRLSRIAFYAQQCHEKRIAYRDRCVNPRDRDQQHENRIYQAQRQEKRARTMLERIAAKRRDTDEYRQFEIGNNECSSLADEIESYREYFEWNDLPQPTYYQLIDGVNRISMRLFKQLVHDCDWLQIDEIYNEIDGMDRNELQEHFLIYL